MGAKSNGTLIGALLLGVIAVVALAVWFLGMDAPAPPPAERRPVAENGARELASASRTSAPRARVSPRVPVTAAADAADAEISPSKRRQWVLQGRLLGLDPEVPWSQPIHVRFARSGIGGFVVLGERSAKVSADGEFRLSLSSEMQSPTPPTVLEIVADDGGYMPRRRLLQLANRRGALPDLPRTWNVDIEVQVAAVLAGRVTRESGQAIAGAQVTAFEIEGNEFRDAGLRQVSTLGDGTYRLRAGRGCEYMVVAFVVPDLADLPRPSLLEPPDHSPRQLRPQGRQRPRLRPASLRSEATLRRESPVPTLVMEPGARLRCQVEFPRNTEESSWISIELLGQTGYKLPVLGSHLFLRPSGEVDYWMVRLPTTSRGWTHSDGFREGWRYLLACTELGRATVHPDVAGFAAEATATDLNVRLRPSGAHLSLRLQSEGGLPLTAEVHLQGPRHQLSKDVEDGRAEFFVAPTATYELTIRGEFYETHRETFSTPEIGGLLQRQITLLRSRRPVDLPLRLQGANSSLIESVWAQLSPHDPSRPPWDEILAVKKGRATVSGLLPDRYDLVAIPILAADARNPFLTPAQITVNVREAAELKEHPPELFFPRGGLLTVEFQNVDPSVPSLPLEVFGASGFPLLLRQQDQGEPRFSTRLSLDPKAIHALQPPLAPGRYTVRIATRDPAWEQVVVIESGGVHTLVVDVGALPARPDSPD